MWGNNEVGTVQPVHALADIARGYGIPMHSDAVQAVGQVPVDFAASGLDAMTVTGHKLGGPMGSGALLLGRGVTLTPMSHGGGQERDIRSGTLDVAAIAGFAVAVELAVKTQAERAERVGVLRDRLIAGVRAAVPDAVLNGPDDTGEALPSGHLPGIAHFSFPGCDGDALLLLLDARGIECSTGSACSAGVPRAEPRAAGHGRGRGGRAGVAALLPGPHQHPGRHRRPARGHRACRRARRPGRPGFARAQWVRGPCAS